jgi:hypothetical protein
MILDENFSYGYDDGIYNLRSKNNSKFNCYYTKASRVHKTLREEAKLVCDKISHESTRLGKIPIILLSGGLDSEVVLRSFLESGKQFKAISNKFLNDLNSHEIDYIEKLKIKFDFDHVYNEIDIVDFLQSQRAKDLISISKCTKPEMLPTMELIYNVAKKMNGVPVLGNGDFYVSKDINESTIQWNYIEYEYILAWMRFCISENITAATNFFQFTPEIVLSVGKDALMKHLFSKSPEGKVSSRSTKYLVYKKNWIDAELRPKYHGSEKVMELCNSLRNGICKNYDTYTELWKMPVDQFLSTLDYEI